MQGIIGNEMGDNLSPESIKSTVKVPPQFQDALDRIVLAGMKVMFDKSTHDLMLKELDGPGATGEKLGKGIAGLMALLWQQSNNSMPPQLIIPAMLILLAQAVDFMKKSGEPVSEQDYGEATQVAVGTVLQMFNLDPNKVAAIGARGMQGAEGGQQPQAPAAPAAPGAPQGA